MIHRCAKLRHTLPLAAACVAALPSFAQQAGGDVPYFNSPVIVNSLKLQGTWTPNGGYYKNDVVPWQGKLYISTAGIPGSPNTPGVPQSGNQPDISPNYWRSFGNFTFLGPWQPNTLYTAGQAVTVVNNQVTSLYVAPADIAANSVFVASNWTFVMASAAPITSVAASRLSAGSAPTVNYSNGVLTVGIPDGAQGTPGQGVTSIVIQSLANGQPATASLSGGVLTLGIPAGPQGTPGQSVTSVSVQSLASGQPATASLSGGALTLGIPAGTPGTPGQSVTSVVIQSLASGSPATASLSGGVLTLGIPAGSQGNPGTPGTPGTPGAAATIAVDSAITPSPDGTTASVVNNGSSSAAQLHFTIPQLSVSYNDTFLSYNRFNPRTLNGPNDCTNPGLSLINPNAPTAGSITFLFGSPCASATRIGGGFLPAGYTPPNGIPTWDKSAFTGNPRDAVFGSAVIMHRGPYTTGSYNTNDVVSSAGFDWRSKVDNNTTVPGSGSSWQQWGGGSSSSTVSYPSGITAAYQLGEAASGGSTTITDSISGQTITIASSTWTPYGIYRVRTPSGSSTAGIVNIPSAQIQGNTLLDVCYKPLPGADEGAASGTYTILGSENYNTRYWQKPTYRLGPAVAEYTDNNTTLSSAAEVINGPHCETMVYAASGIKLYANGQPVHYTKQVALDAGHAGDAAHANPYFDVNGGTYTLGAGTSAGAWGISWELYSFSIGTYSNDAQVAQLFQADKQVLATKGVNVSNPSNGSTMPLIEFTGDSKQGSGGSQTLGNGKFGPVLPALQAYGKGAEGRVTAMGGQTLCVTNGTEGETSANGLANQISYNLLAFSGVKIDDDNAGTNDLPGGTTVATLHACDAAAYNAVNATGAYRVKGTITPRYGTQALTTANETNRQNYNADIRTNTAPALQAVSSTSTPTSDWIYDLDEDPYLNPPASTVDANIYRTVYCDTATSGLHECAATYAYEAYRRALAYRWAAGDTSPFVVPIYVNFWNLYQTAGTAQTLPLLTLYGGQRVCGVTTQVTTAYTGSGTFTSLQATVTDSLGGSYSSPQSLSTTGTVSNDRTDSPPPLHGRVQLSVSAAGANLSTLTAGSSITLITVCGS